MLQNLKRYHSVALFILIFAFFLSLYKLDTLPPPIHIDEAFMTGSAIRLLEGTQHPLDTYYSITLLGNLLSSFFIGVFGVTSFIIRLQSVVFGILTLLFLYLLTYELFGKKIALWALLFETFSHVHIAYSRANFPNIQAPFFLCASLYMTCLSIRKQKGILFFFSGLISSLALYSYTGAKIIPLVVILFLFFSRKALTWRHALLFFLGLFFGSMPLLVYILSPNQNYLQRESQTTLLSNQQYFYDRWQTRSIPVILYEQLKLNLLGFFSAGDYSNQYGNGPLLDSISKLLFKIFGLIAIIVFFVKNNLVKKTFLSFSLIAFLGLFFLVSLTESPPLSTRLLILFPFISIFLGITLEALYLFMSRFHHLAARLFLIGLLSGAIFLNLKLYFYDYPLQKAAYFQWIEPNSSIALFAKRNPGRKLYLIPNPHVYSTHIIMYVLTYPRNPIYQINSDYELEQLLRSPESFDLILPLVPESAIVERTSLYRSIDFLTNGPDYTKQIMYGTACTRCATQPLFQVISKRRAF